MKKLLLVLVLALSFVSLQTKASALPKLCGMSASYRAIYEYPTGSYWVNQINQYPQYYANNNTYFQNKYGC